MLKSLYQHLYKEDFTMANLLHKFERDIHVRGFSNSTIKSYMYKLKFK